MRLSLNLARAPSFRARYGLWMAIPGLILTLALLVWLAASTVSAFRRLRDVRRSTAELQSRQQDLKRMEASLESELSQPATQKLLRETSYVNGLIEARKFSVAELTDKVSKLMPPDVRLDSLALSSPGDKPTIRLSVEGKTQASIEDFLIHLENSNDFSDVIVTSQSYPGGTINEGMVVTNCTALYLDAALPEGPETRFHARRETPIYTEIR